MQKLASVAVLASALLPFSADVDPVAAACLLVAETVLVAFEQLAVDDGANLVTEPFVVTIGIVGFHPAVLFHVPSHPRMPAYLLAEQGFQDPCLRDRTYVKEQVVPISEETMEILVLHLDALDALEIVDVVINFSDFVGLKDEPVYLATLEDATCLVLHDLKVLDLVPEVGRKKVSW